jgi:uncharacterized protein YjbJ (UPF0337 family)
MRWLEGTADKIAGTAKEGVAEIIWAMPDCRKRGKAQKCKGVTGKIEHTDVKSALIWTSLPEASRPDRIRSLR